MILLLSMMHWQCGDVDIAAEERIYDIPVILCLKDQMIQSFDMKLCGNNENFIENIC